MQKMETVMKPASEGHEFGLESMQAGTAEGSSTSCPVTLVFRYLPYPCHTTSPIPCLSEVQGAPGPFLRCHMKGP